jgi:hypothetical protein
MIQELDQPFDRGRFQIAVPAAEPPVIADRELILMALAQLLDSSLKYSIRVPRPISALLQRKPLGFSECVTRGL